MNDLAEHALEELAADIELGPGHHLEARLAYRAEAPLAVLCHPHPLFGGSMDNEVVILLRDALQRLQYGTVRFNFRGVGRSAGSYGGGTGEADDLAALCAALERHGHAARGLHVAGYSFGAWVALRACSEGLRPRSLLLVAPPVDFMSFAALRLPDAPCRVVVGAQDELCSQPTLQSWLRGQPAASVDVQVLAGCDHFFGAGLAALRDAVLSFAAGLPR